MSQPELLAAYFTLAGDVYPYGPDHVSPFSFQERVEAAAKAGYTGIGFFTDDVYANVERLGFPEMRRILEVNGIRHIELEFLIDWFLDGERRTASDGVRKLMLDAAEGLGARAIKIGPGVGADINNPTEAEMTPNIPLMQDAFAILCQDAAKVGTSIAMELMPFGNVRTVDVGLAIVEGANQPNGGLDIDVWHVTRGGNDYADLARIPGKYMICVELNDANADVNGTLWNDTAHHRQLCGEGDWNLKSFVENVRNTGFQGPWGVEIISAVHRKLPLGEAADRSFQTARALLD
ncbi:sugar phosphate isomerase/epimerase [Novosphingobium sp. ST904]|uniref:sugar phosphate isomerase/epimerase family protein n=1 Tax=Novosphingobium sp. ST904 TaxID=1684385 RepID=UPI0006C8C016|nr:sugar phosphate isomerase/epimerase [Novosphingobium sp. ST904]KPH64045.1 xylose isomerase [Novosphingobium sp. ST904]TCM32479.1 sugar phosphate isomerase/epimerase [Novosphingobium sp. ST904]